MAGDFPNWLGPLLTSVLLIVIIICVCWYYCYWKPKKEKQNKDTESGIEAGVKRDTGCPVIHDKRHNKLSPHRTLGGKYEDDSTYWGYTGPSGLVGMNYGSYGLDYCPISDTQLPICNEYTLPKFQYSKYDYANKCKMVSQKCRDPRKGSPARCKKIERTHCASAHVKKCMKGECVHPPSLPAIMEGESMGSLCLEEAEEEFGPVKNACCYTRENELVYNNIIAPPAKPDDKKSDYKATVDGLDICVSCEGNTCHETV
ncbi:predicted protein [Nematostella vectensis]|uniref:Uncharacterized protein n=1 Tax=Nematostella vectensis TaxID=45351 RepID=A7T2Z3_NEMVE|nr:predicted protein [Nematostella vectensis]|eukprot:XP_001621770.1 hypothetical protein NEMVEDRAFT_v1g248639 [Nematostella vectensis]